MRLQGYLGRICAANLQVLQCYLRGLCRDCNQQVLSLHPPLAAGDSRCVLSKRGQARALTLDHKPILFEEAKRIIKVGW